MKTKIIKEIRQILKDSVDEKTLNSPETLF